MDYKEKYEMALEGIQEILGSGADSIKMSRLQLRLQGIFPELKESEDEDKIMKELIYNIIVSNDNTPSSKEIFSVYCKTKEDALAWLEKQGEQKLSDKVEPKFKICDWVVHDMSDGRKVIRQIIGMTDKSYILDGEGSNTFYFNDLENDYHLWAIQDAKDGDVLAEDSCMFIIEKMKSEGMAIVHCCLFDDGYFDLIGSTLCFDVYSTYPATKEQRDLLFQKIHEAGYEWDTEKKELKKIEQSELTEFEEVEKVEFTGRFQKPDWYAEAEK